MDIIVRRFKVVAGKHHASDTVKYRAGDVLESTRRLDQIFVNKFIEVSDVTPVTAPPDPAGVPPPVPKISPPASLQGIIELEVRCQELHKKNEELRNTAEKLGEALNRAHAELEVLRTPPVQVPASKKTSKKGSSEAAPAPVGDQQW